MKNTLVSLKSHKKELNGVFKKFSNFFIKSKRNQL